MSGDWKKDLSDSARDFSEVVWPVIRPWCGGGFIEPVETMPGPWAEAFDQLCGIDAWQIVGARDGMRGIASRVQWANGHGVPCWGTTTIRLERDTGTKTEWQKNVDVIENGGRGFLMPWLRVHAYMDRPRGTLAGVCVVENWRLITYIQEHGAHKRRTDNAWFCFLPWEVLHSELGARYQCFHEGAHPSPGRLRFDPHQLELCSSVS